ncbi:1-phosphatidylinositol 3-phosphate 5-kinase [Tribolium castaneum]|uniref:1-phosphatidylinositol-3-phosphate 5-kinase n=1 Tax=Tribolium castaneum TaxID=7070 RepID=D6WE46_TRICA|nr:PREDICTED: 1-phosphatidylinositol 3-phosphate 5-kinase isoform X1 [Tribolium castaneum]EFA00380.1 Putative 1-phosphatidylinositol 3-phosphate 5-kinase-like Protein [Tribolium castaneum]|eukprot:XP_970298.1 PREDICTED: 1-phosphatidylinositol 3-phosphate 5-kinase isoform X1 [Tribolium castaneum]
MNKNLQSPTKLTEFAPIQTEEKPQTVGQFITKIFKFNKGPNSEEQNSGLTPNSDNVSQESLPTWAIESDSSATPFHVDVNEGRSLPNVLKRISNLLALKTTNLQDYSDTELKQYWMPDSVSKECYQCCEKFTTFRRRHHCRVCGQIFCSQCCNQQIPGKIFGCTGDLRVCTYCCKVVLSYLQSSDVGADLTADLKLLQENLQSKFGNDVLSPTVQDNIQNLNKDSVEVGNILRRKISVGYQEEKFASGQSSMYLTTEEKCKALQNSVSLRALFEEICRTTTGIPLGTHRYRLRTYTDCFLGSELVDWLICQQKANSRVQAAAISQALLEGGYIECVSDPCSFVDGYALYKPGIFVTPEVLNHNYFEVPNQEEPIWVQQIPQESSTTDSDNEQVSVKKRGPLTSSSSYMLDLNVEANTVYLSRPLASSYSIQSGDSGDVSCCETDITTVRTSEQREFVPEAGWHNASNLREENGEKLAYNLLTEAYQQHEQGLLKQLLASNGLLLSWADVIIPLCNEIINVIRPDKNHDAEDLDIRHYIKFKKLSGGSRTDTKLISGIVFTKNVAHKGMLTEIDNPKILLLQCSIVYQRTEGRLMSLEPVLMQEHEYLRHVAARIVALQPDIVLVHRNVSRLAQDLLRQHGITLVHNVKQSVLDQLARCTEADLVTAVDAHIGRPRLGTCKKFYLKTYNVDKGGAKTLMFFEGLPMVHLGGTVLLRGGSRQELTRLEKVVSFCLFASYNWRLEKSFLMDEFAQPPNPNCEFLEDSSKESSPRLQTVVKYDSGGKKMNSEMVEDFTDPLQSSFVESMTEGKEILAVAELPFSNNFRKSLDDSILCISPYLMFSVPYLETEVGKKCKLRKFFPTEIYFSEQFTNQTKVKIIKDIGEDVKENEQKSVKPLHPFLRTKITTSVDNNEIQSLLAHFRACGGSYEKREILCKPPVQVDEEILQNKDKNYYNKLDVLEINNHQRLSVLFCSFSHESTNSPAFCVNPWIVNMNFYGSNDIPLGCFLERYCFRSTYNCPSKPCGTPMFKHIRRFVHNAGCVSISLNNFDNEFTEENIVMWSWCTKCQSVSPVVLMSADTWSFSFAKYLELKFYGGLYSRRGNTPCGHSLHHDHYQYFGYKNSVASFKYTPIQVWDISLPPPVIYIQYDIEKQQTELIDEIRTMAQKGHEIYSLILEKLSCIPAELEGLGNLKQLLLKEQTQFKQKVEEVQLKLTSPTIENKQFDETPEKLHIAYWKISDSLIRIKRLIVETVDNWNLRLSESARKRDDKKKDRTSYSDLESPTIPENKTLSETDISHSETSNSATITKKIKSLDQSDESELSMSSSPKCHHRSQSDGTVMSHNEEQNDCKKDSDKKTVKNILSQLLPSSSALTLIPNPFNPQDHYTLPTGVSVPIIVYESEPSSIIAYALNSYDYKKSFEDLTKKSNTEQTPSPIVKRKNPNTDKNDETSGLLGFLRNKNDLNSPVSASESPQNIEVTEKSKNLHIEVQFQDTHCNFFCRTYFAEKFASLRGLVLPIGEEGYVRSLARSVQWNARGGKSGSNFAKTADDRFVLKEMSKSEVQLFLESAPNYFNYMQKCYGTGQPTLLGKIIGIYQIIFKNNNSNVTLRTNLLVMENLFYKRTVSQKFDLKGSMRNRLVVPDNQEGEIVLLDENLLKMTCDAPLYILPHSKAVLTAAIQNDTEFLSAQSVMDYSLLVGLDSENRELVLGIIDYIRTFTWDKKLETMVKKSGILGGQGKLPTIVSPEEYQKRFIEAMHRYFLEVPDHWAGLGKGLEF